MRHNLNPGSPTYVLLLSVSLTELFFKELYFDSKQFFFGDGEDLAVEWFY